MKWEVTKANFLVYAAQHYTNPKCIDEEEFFEDLKRFKYLKRLFNKYAQTGELAERLVLNHLIVIFNVFGIEAGIEMLGVKIEYSHWGSLKPFLVFLKAIQNTEITDIPMDIIVVEKLRNL